MERYDQGKQLRRHKQSIELATESPVIFVWHYTQDEQLQYLSSTKDEGNRRLDWRFAT